MSGRLIGVDAGGTMTKGCAVRPRRSRACLRAARQHDAVPAPGHTERDPDKMWGAACSAIGAVLPESGARPGDVLAVAATGYGAGLYLVDRALDPVRPGIVSTDTRAAGLVADWKDSGLASEFGAQMQQRVWASQSSVLLAHLHRHEKGLLDRTHSVLLCKDFLRARLCGDCSTDPTDAGISGLIDVTTGRYAEDMFRGMGIGGWIERLPPIGRSDAVVGHVTPEAARLTGLLDGTPVVRGVVDVAAASLGSCLTDASLMTIVAGTFSITQTLHRGPRLSRLPFLQCLHPIDGYYLATEGAATSAGNLEWFCRVMLDAEAQRAAASGHSIYEVCEHLVRDGIGHDSDILFYPFLFGGPGGAPAGLLGLTASGALSDVVCAIDEGIVFAHRMDIDALLSGHDAARPATVRLAGGGGRSQVWPQLFADVLHLPVEVMECTELGAQGSAICAAAAIGAAPDMAAAARRMTRIARSYAPNAGRAERDERFTATAAMLGRAWGSRPRARPNSNPQEPDPDAPWWRPRRRAVDADWGWSSCSACPEGRPRRCTRASPRAPRIRHVLGRDERSGPDAADAYARLTGKPGITDVTVGPGTTKLPEGLVEALNASIPMVALVGELPLDWTSLRAKGAASQGFDQQGFLQTITKATFTVPSLAALPDLLRTAFRIATAPRPGPVALIIPHDVMDGEWDGAPIAVDTRHARIPSVRYRPDDAEIEAAAALLRASRRPAFVFGGGVHGAEACEVVTAFCDAQRLLVVTSLSGKGAVPETRPYCAGMLNPLGSAAALELVREADLLVWCGSKASQNTALNWTLPRPDQATIVIDADPLEAGRTFRPTLSLCGDVRLTMAALHRAAAAGARDRPERRAWTERIADVIMAYRERLAAEIASEAVPMLPQRDGGGGDPSGCRRYRDQRCELVGRLDRELHHGGARGTPLPLCARPGRPRLRGARRERRRRAAAGERRARGHGGGGRGAYVVGELATLAQNRFRVVNIVLNNGTLGWLRMWQELFFLNLRQSVDLSFGDLPNYADAASTFGLPGLPGLPGLLGLLGRRVRTPDELPEALDAAFAHDGPSVIEVMIDARQTPIHGFLRRLAEPGKRKVRLGTLYELREWTCSPAMPGGAEKIPAE